MSDNSTLWNSAFCMEDDNSVFYISMFCSKVRSVQVYNVRLRFVILRFVFLRYVTDPQIWVSTFFLCLTKIFCGQIYIYYTYIIHVTRACNIFSLNSYQDAQNKFVNISRWKLALKWHFGLTCHQCALKCLRQNYAHNALAKIILKGRWTLL